MWPRRPRFEIKLRNGIVKRKRRVLSSSSTSPIWAGSQPPTASARSQRRRSCPRRSRAGCPVAEALGGRRRAHSPGDFPRRGRDRPSCLRDRAAQPSSRPQSDPEESVPVRSSRQSSSLSSGTLTIPSKRTGGDSVDRPAADAEQAAACSGRPGYPRGGERDGPGAGKCGHRPEGICRRMLEKTPKKVSTVAGIVSSANAPQAR